MTEKLKPCPFCGGEAILQRGVFVNDVWHDDFIIFCDNDDCEVCTRRFNTMQEAVEAWNRRVKDE